MSWVTKRSCALGTLDIKEEEEEEALHAPAWLGRGCHRFVCIESCEDAYSAEPISAWQDTRARGERRGYAPTAQRCARHLRNGTERHSNPTTFPCIEK